MRKKSHCDLLERQTWKLTSSVQNEAAALMDWCRSSCFNLQQRSIKEIGTPNYENGQNTRKGSRTCRNYSFQFYDHVPFKINRKSEVLWHVHPTDWSSSDGMRPTGKRAGRLSPGEGPGNRPRGNTWKLPSEPNQLAWDVGWWEGIRGQPNQNMKGTKRLDLNRSFKQCINPFKNLLPDVREFKITIRGPDPLFRKHGLDKKLKPLLEFERYKNSRLNRYAKMQIIRLNRHLLEGRIYWRIAEMLLRKSLVFGLLSLHHKFPLWQREHSLWKIKKIYKEFEELRQETGLQTLIYKRRYVLKSDNVTKRPLGVPTPAWRMYMSLWNQLLAIYLKNSYSPEQHGFTTGRGTTTAWTSVIRRLMTAKHVLCYDLRECFERIVISETSLLLEELGVSRRLVDQLDEINRSPIELPEVHEIDERVAISKRAADKEYKEWKRSEASKYVEDAKSCYDNGPLTKYDWLWFVKKEQTRSEEHYGDWELGEQIEDTETADMDRGLPQGSPTSPLLSILSISRSKLGSYPHVMYADDGILFDVDPLSLPDVTELSDEKYGVLIHPSPEKTYWARKWGEELRPIKFLGLIIENGELRSETRKGKSLKLDQWELLSEEAQRNTLRELGRQTERKRMKKRNYLKGKPWEDYMMSTIQGYIISRLYAGTWNREDFDQDFHLKFKEGSYISYYRKHESNPWKLKMREDLKLNIFNSSSVAISWMARYQRKIRKQNLKKKLSG